MQTRTERVRDRVKEPIKTVRDLTTLEHQLLGVIAAGTLINGSGYIASWTIGELMGRDAAWLDSYIPGTDGDDAMDRLIAAGLVEELPDLGCRYRLTP